MAVASPSFTVCARLLPSHFSPSSVSSPFYGTHCALPAIARGRARRFRSVVRAGAEIDPAEDLTIKKFQIPGFRPIWKSADGEVLNAGNKEAPSVSRRQAMAGAVAGVLAAAAGGAGISQAEEAQVEGFENAPSGLGFKETTEGTGAEPVKGQLIKAHYTGRLASTGKVFDTSYTRGRPLTFRVGAGEVIKGWDQGILGAEGIPPMKAGGKRVLRIPAELAYGARGAGCRGGTCAIPPNSTLIFDVEFLGKANG